MSALLWRLADHGHDGGSARMILSRLSTPLASVQHLVLVQVCLSGSVNTLQGIQPKLVAKQTDQKQKSVIATYTSHETRRLADRLPSPAVAAMRDWVHTTCSARLASKCTSAEAGRTLMQSRLEKMVGIGVGRNIDYTTP